MTQYNWGIDLPFSASGDLSAKQYYFMKLATTAGRVLTANGASNPIAIGVLQNDPASGQEAQVRILGSTQVYVSSSTAIAYGDWVMCASDGGAEYMIGGASSVQGIALEAVAAGKNAYIEVLLMPFSSVTSDNTP